VAPRGNKRRAEGNGYPSALEDASAWDEHERDDTHLVHDSRGPVYRPRRVTVRQFAST